MGQLSRHSNLLWAGRFGDQIPVGARYSTPIQISPGAHPAPYTMGTGSFPRAKRARRGIDHPSQSSAKVKERVGLHLYSPFGPSWSVLGRNLLGLRPRTSCIEKFKKLQILTAPCLCILEKMFGIKNPDKYQTNVSIQSKDTRQKIQLHLQSLRLSSIQKNVCYSSIRIFNKLPPHIVQLRENTMAFKNTLKKFLKNAVYSINDFLLGDF